MYYYFYIKLYEQSSRVCFVDSPNSKSQQILNCKSVELKKKVHKLDNY